MRCSKSAPVLLNGSTGQKGFNYFVAGLDRLAEPFSFGTAAFGHVWPAAAFAAKDRHDLFYHVAGLDLVFQIVGHADYHTSLPFVPAAAHDNAGFQAGE